MTQHPAETASRRLLWAMIGALVVLWAALTLVREWTDGKDAAALGDHLWEVRVGVLVDGAKRGTRASVAIPRATEHLRLVAQQATFQGWRQRYVSTDLEKGSRRIRLTATAPGSQFLEVGFTVHQSAAPLLRRPELPRPLSVSELETYLASDPLLALGHDLVASEVALLTSGSESLEEVRRRIAIRAHQLLPAGDASPRPVPEVLASGRAGLLERSLVMVALCRAANMPARLVTGLVLEDKSPSPLHHWVEVYDDKAGWLAYAPLRGYREGVPETYLPMATGQADIVLVGGAKADIRYSVAQADELLDTKAGEEGNWSALFYLTRLPLEVREALAVLLLIPLSVLLSMAFREWTGVHSYGVFTPTLFALVLTRAPWQSAAMMLGLVLLFGVLGRLALPAHLKRSPRLTLVITLVALGSVASISLMEYFNWNPDGPVVLLSIVILSTMVDRIYKTLDTEGLESVLSRLGWTLVQAVFLCLPVMQYQALGHQLVLRPESHLLTLAAILLVAARQGAVLADHPRFRWMRWPASRRKPSGDDELSQAGN